MRRRRRFLRPRRTSRRCSVNVTVELSVVTTLLYASSTFTVTAGLMAAARGRTGRLLAENDLGRRRWADREAVAGARGRQRAIGRRQRVAAHHVDLQTAESGHATRCGGGGGA